MKIKKNFKRIIKASDLFPSNVEFRENKDESLASSFGGGLSIMLILVALLYAVKKTIILYERDDLLITEYSEKNALEDGPIRYDQTHFFIAIGFRLFNNTMLSNVTDFFDIVGWNFIENGAAVEG